MPLQALHRTLYGRFLFVVSIMGFDSAGFQEATGLRMSIAKIQYYEGGALAAQNEPGRVTYDDLVLRRGASQDQDFISWVREVINIRAHLPGGIGNISPSFKRDLTLQQMERDRTTVIEYPVSQAFPISFSPGDFNNDSDELSIDELTLCYHHFEVDHQGQPAA